MKRASSKNPSAASLRDIPEVDFSAFDLKRNPYAAQIKAAGIQIVHDGPSEESLREIPEADPTATAQSNPYAARIKADGMQLRIGQGRPARGEEVGPTPARSIRLPIELWKRVEAVARAEGITVHALLRRAVLRALADADALDTKHAKTRKTG